MKKSELKQMIREEIQKLNEGAKVKLEKGSKTSKIDKKDKATSLGIKIANDLAKKMESDEVIKVTLFSIKGTVDGNPAPSDTANLIFPNLNTIEISSGDSGYSISYSKDDRYYDLKNKNEAQVMKIAERIAFAKRKKMNTSGGGSGNKDWADRYFEK